MWRVAAHVLFVCSGNIARSAFAERYAAMRADQFARPGIVFSSAGFDAVEGFAMEPRMAAELVARGGSPAGFRARQVEPKLMAGVDLVLTMTVRQRHLLATRFVFTADLVHPLGHAVRLLPQVAPATVTSLGHQLTALAPGYDRRDDIPDPMHAGPQAARAVADRICELVDALLDGLT